MKSRQNESIKQNTLTALDSPFAKLPGIFNTEMMKNTADKFNSIKLNRFAILNLQKS